MSASNNNVLVKQLIEFGLSEKEAKIYLALLELEVATVTEVAETAGINRSSTYVVMEALKKKGLVSTSEDKKIQTYSAVSPEMLLEDAKNKAKRADAIKNNINDIVPELKALHKDTKQKPRVRVFEGKQALINALDDSLNNKEKVMRECSSTKNLLKIIPEDVSAYIQKRIELGIKLYGIHPDDRIEQKITEMFPNLLKLDKSIFIPQKKYQFNADLVIYDNRIAYFSPDKKGFAVIIESKEIADVMKSVFDLAYEEAKRLSKKLK